LFFLEEKGFLRKKVVLKTEYGVEIGECHFIRNAQNGIIYLNDRKFVFNGDNSEIRIADKQNNLVHCKLQQEVAALQWPALLFSLSLIYSQAEKQGSQMVAR
jgi:hypothetical protein